MSNKEYLDELIKKFDDTDQSKKNKIVNTLQKTDDILKAKMLSQKIIQGDLNDVKDAAIDNLIIAFGGDINQISDNDLDINSTTKDDVIVFVKEKTDVEIENERLKEQMNRIKNEYEAKLKQLEKENNTLKELAYLTNNAMLIEVPDEDINELYIRYMKDGTLNYKDAFIINKIVPKKYYSL